MLFKRSKTGAVLTWEIEVEGNKHRTISGQEDGQKVTSEWTVCKGKNIGKANETTPERQAQLEAAAKEQKKIDREQYVKDINDIDKNAFKPPMLAEEYEKVISKRPLVFPVFSQPKLDGMRCRLDSTGMWSRNGKEILSAPHIAAELKHLTDQGIIFDGELYNHGLRDNFDKLISLVKKQKPSSEDLKESEEHVQYWIYDIQDTSECFMDRSLQLKKMFIPSLGGTEFKHARCVYTFKHFTPEDLDKAFQEFLKEGFEGQMIRTDTVYEHCRTKALLKRKLMLEQEFEILDVMEGKGNRSGIAGAVKINLGNDVQDSSIIGSHDFCRRLLEEKDQVIGKLGTVKFQNFTPDGRLRFPELKAIRDYD